MYAGCNVESKSDPSLNVTALRTTILKAVSDGETKFQGLVLSSQVRTGGLLCISTTTLLFTVISNTGTHITD